MNSREGIMAWLAVFIQIVLAMASLLDTSFTSSFAKDTPNNLRKKRPELPKQEELSMADNHCYRMISYCLEHPRSDFPSPFEFPNSGTTVNVKITPEYKAALKKVKGAPASGDVITDHKFETTETSEGKKRQESFQVNINGIIKYSLEFLNGKTIRIQVYENTVRDNLPYRSYRECEFEHKTGDPDSCIKKVERNGVFNSEGKLTDNRLVIFDPQFCSNIKNYYPKYKALCADQDHRDISSECWSLLKIIEEQYSIRAKQIQSENTKLFFNGVTPKSEKEIASSEDQNPYSRIETQTNVVFLFSYCKSDYRDFEKPAADGDTKPSLPRSSQGSPKSRESKGAGGSNGSP